MIILLWWLFVSCLSVASEHSLQLKPIPTYAALSSEQFDRTYRDPKTEAELIIPEAPQGFRRPVLSHEINPSYFMAGGAILVAAGYALPYAMTAVAQGVEQSMNVLLQDVINSPAKLLKAAGMITTLCAVGWQRWRRYEADMSGISDQLLSYHQYALASRDAMGGMLGLIKQYQDVAYRAEKRSLYTFAALSHFIEYNRSVSNEMNANMQKIGKHTHEPDDKRLSSDLTGVRSQLAHLSSEASRTSQASAFNKQSIEALGAEMRVIASRVSENSHAHTQSIIALGAEVRSMGDRFSSEIHTLTERMNAPSAFQGAKRAFLQTITSVSQPSGRRPSLSGSSSSTPQIPPSPTPSSSPSVAQTPLAQPMSAQENGSGDGSLQPRDDD